MNRPNNVNSYFFLNFLNFRKLHEKRKKEKPIDAIEDQEKLSRSVKSRHLKLEPESIGKVMNMESNVHVVFKGTVA
jgi:hypothetical protein